MIQELLGDILEERKISFNPGALTAASSSSLKSSPSPVSSPATSSEPQPNLRCPRCESTNTKFCYYNNYNLTQPRHFCKTCRRYWTKGGALRNVPIGGGCRKARPKPRSDRPCPALGFDQDLPAPVPVPWASTPYSSQLLALLRASQFQNANPNVLSPITNPDLITSYKIKEEAASGMFGSQLGMGFDQLAVGPSGRQFQQQQHNSLLLGEVQQQQQQSSGTQDLYQRLRSLGNYNHEQSTAMTNSPLLMEPLPLAGGEISMGYWNPAMPSWADLPTANGTAFL